jgi:UDP-2,3-diacylglucosamine hydrolase
VLDALARASGRGVSIEAIAGNRDFLLDRSFAERTGVALRGEEWVTEVAGRRALLLHGDTLCTLDRAYQRYRKVVRSPLVRALARLLPGTGALAGGLRAKSRKAVAAKPPQTKSIVPEAAAVAAGERGCTLVLCGHAHVPSVRRVGGVTLVVLPAWGEEGTGAAEIDGELRSLDPRGGPGGVLLRHAP